MVRLCLVPINYRGNIIPERANSGLRELIYKAKLKVQNDNNMSAVFH